MSGVDISKEEKEKQIHVCESCMKTVIETCGHFQEVIAQLKREKLKLQEELNNLKEDQKKQKRFMRKEIKMLEKKLALLNK
jgi:hypothetical protein